MIKLIKQKHSKGCGIACIAMVCGKSYDKIANDLFGKLGKVDGMYLSDAQNYLKKHKYITTKTIYPLSLSDGEKYEEVIKPTCFAHICQVKVFKDSPTDHFIVMDGKGILFDPIFGITKWIDYSCAPISITGFKKNKSI